MFRRALLGTASALLLPLSLQAQSESTSSPSPLEVTVKPTGQQKQFVSLFTHQSISVPELYFDIRNVSQKCVVGISLRAEDKDSEGKVMATGGATFFRQHDGKLSCLEPGQAFSESDRTNSLDESGNPTKKDVTVDFVIFSDGSTWGPGNDLEQKGYLRGKFDAYKQMQIQKNKENCNSHSNGSPPLPAESWVFSGAHQMPPNLLLHPEFNVGKTSARVPYRKVVDPTPQNRIEQFDHPPYGLADVSLEDFLELL